MNTSITADEIRTSDTWFAAFLLATEEPLKGIEKDGRRVIFVFASEEGDDLQVAFLGGAQVSARAYADAHLRLKQIIHDAQRAGGGQ